MDDETREKLNEASRKTREEYKEMLGGVPGFPEGAVRSLYYDREGKPIELGDYASLMETGDGEPNLDYRIVAKTRFDSDLEVSTVWLGIDHSFIGTGPPLIFETMIFRWLEEPEVVTSVLFGSYVKERESAALDDEWEHQQRYATEEQALHGHKAVCEELERRGHIPVLRESPRGD